MMENLSATYEEAREDFLSALARKNFGIPYIYPWQRFVVTCILDAYECRRENQGQDDFSAAVREDDSYCHGRQIVLLPTGAGKSLCFQLPALVFPGPTLVIYPLLALMADQQRRMAGTSLGSVMFRGGMTAVEIEENFRRIDEGAKIIIANPEVLGNQRIMERLRGIGISHIAIDEAHCCSEWGDSFRPAYLGLGDVIKKIDPPVVTAFTATASPSVLERVSRILFDGQAHIIRSESDRKNIWYYVRYAAAKKKEALYLASTQPRPMIIFCGTRAKAEDMAIELNVFFCDDTARFYHAGLARAEKEEVEKWFYDSTDGVLCATCAYGMGVDKKDIKTVVHLDAPSTAEAYIQEAGRGGRDGSVAKAFLIWSPADSVRFAAIPDRSHAAYMREFAESGRCRRQVLLDALGAEQAVCSGCDVCNGETSLHEADWTLAQGLVRRNRFLYTKNILEERLFRELNIQSRKRFGMNAWSHGDCADVVDQMIERGFVREVRGLRRLFWRGGLHAPASDSG